jgi:acyl CoA:acetate/3-ketoacid CoA transferase beta subunit
MTEPGYTKTELMICVAARLFEDATTCFIGTGIPMLAAMLASRTTAPNLVPILSSAEWKRPGRFPIAWGAHVSQGWRRQDRDDGDRQRLLVG